MTNMVLLGEAYGEEEERERTPFVGVSGYLLTKMLEEAGITRADCHLTNVLNLRPPGNKLEALCGPKGDGIPGYPALLKSKYLRAEFSSELVRLGQELDEIKPNLVVALGNTALWALCGRTAISKSRGTTCISSHAASGIKVLGTYHPAAVARDWALRPITIIDFLKAKREAEFPEIRRPKRKIWIEPDLNDLETFYEQYIRPRSEQGYITSADIETAGTQITCMGFGYPDIALVIPIADPRREDRSYWPTKEDELKVWGFIRRVCGDGRILKSFQNGLYDIAFLWRTKGIKVFGAEHDSMLMHHAMQPESLKSLGFLGSVYTDEGSWKGMRQRETTIKKDA
jgi:uracil-DNA glycosylase